MFGFLKNNPLAKLEKRYAETLTKAVEAQRNGNIELYSKLSVQAESLLKEIDSHKKEKN